MSFHIKCARCGSMTEADADDNGPTTPTDWGLVSVEMGDGNAWDSEYQDSHLCATCLIELSDFLRGCKIAYEGK